MTIEAKSWTILRRQLDDLGFGRVNIVFLGEL